MSLARFDRLRSADPAAALAGYARHLGEIEAGDADRLDWICRQDLRGRSEFEPLLAKAWESAERGVLRRRLGGTLALLAEQQGRSDEAKALFQEAVSIERDNPDDAWLRACLNLSVCFGRERRVLESLILARRGIDVAAELQDRKWEAFAWKRYCSMLVLIEDARRLERDLERAEACVARISDEPARSVLQVELLFCRAELARMGKEPAFALELLRMCRERIESLGGRAYYMNAWRVYRARDLIELGRYEAAAASLDAVCRPIDPGHARSVDLCRIRLLIATAEREAALLAAADALRRLASQPAGIAYYDTLWLGHRLAGDLHSRHLARRAFELAAGALLTRVAEVDRCARDFPEIESAPSDIQRVLTDYRERLASDYGEILTVVAQSLRQHLTQHGTARPDDDRLAVCAWCHRVQGPSDRWLPIAHFVPPEPALEVSHGICPRCAEEHFEESR